MMANRANCDEISVRRLLLLLLLLLCRLEFNGKVGSRCAYLQTDLNRALDVCFLYMNLLCLFNPGLICVFLFEAEDDEKEGCGRKR